mgnify:CR=1 FL=1
MVCIVGWNADSGGGDWVGDVCAYRAGVGAWVRGRDGRRVGAVAIATVAIGVGSGAPVAVGDPAVAPGSVRAEADTVAATCAVIVV